jgi:hypothetical protein
MLDMRGLLCLPFDVLVHVLCEGGRVAERAIEHLKLRELLSMRCAFEAPLAQQFAELSSAQRNCVGSSDW